MKRRGESDLWAAVAATVTPLPSRLAPPPTEPPPPTPGEAARKRGPAPRMPRAPTSAPAPPRAIEPGRLRRIGRGGGAIERRIDLHGLDQPAARAALAEAILAARAAGSRTVLVITGKGLGGAGVLRRLVPEWLAAPPLRAAIAGISPAGRKDGGAGALYVALRRER